MAKLLKQKKNELEHINKEVIKLQEEVDNKESQKKDLEKRI